MHKSEVLEGLLAKGERTHRLSMIGKAWLLEQGYELWRKGGRGPSKVWVGRKGAESKTFCVRTTLDRAIAFHPLDDGTKFKTLSDVDAVVVVSVNSIENPTGYQVYCLPAVDVQRHFEEAYTARVKAGRKVSDQMGMWVRLDSEDESSATFAGSGILEGHKPVNTGMLEDGAGAIEIEHAGNTEDEQYEFKTIASVLVWAKDKIAELSHLDRRSVHIDVRLGD